VDGKDLLPTRWKSVSYLDIFGPIVKELRGLLDATGLGIHAHHDNEDDENGDISNLFDFVDKDRSGTITMKEWLEAFDSIDTDRNGMLSKMEWKKHHGSVAIFDVVDSDRGGSISRDEWRRAFKSFDRNGDGTISCQEWCADNGSPVGPKGVNIQFDDVADARVEIARNKLAKAIGKTNVSSRTQKGQIKLAINIAKLVGLREDDTQIQEAKQSLARLEFPKEVRHLQVVLDDWQTGEVARHLDRRQRGDLRHMCERIDEIAEGVGMPALGKNRPASLGPGKKVMSCCIGKSSADEPPTLLRGLTDGTIAVRTRTDRPVWTCVAPKGRAPYWVGSPTFEGNRGFAEEVPPDAEGAEFHVMKERVEQLVDRAESLFQNELDDTNPELADAPACSASEPKRPFSDDSKGFEDMDYDLSEQGGDKKVMEARRKNFRRYHHPIVAYRLLSKFMVGIWLTGLVVHSLRYSSDRGWLKLPGDSNARRLSGELPFFFGDGIGIEDVSGSPSAPGLRGGIAPVLGTLFPLPENFFRPKSLLCSTPRVEGKASAQRPDHLIASNGYLVYVLEAAGEGGAQHRLQTLECPVDEHDALVKAECDEGGCWAIVAARGALWKCSGEGLKGDNARPVMSTSKAYSAKRPPLHFWAPADAALSMVFAAPSVGGPIVELRKSGSGLHPMAELQLPASMPKEPEWKLLTVTDDGLLVGIFTTAEQPWPTAVAWSLASGAFLDSRAVPMGRSSEGTEWLGWCAGIGGNLFGAASAAVGRNAELKRFPMPSLL